MRGCVSLMRINYYADYRPLSIEESRGWSLGITGISNIQSLDSYLQL